jgi:hypothetical protein
MIVAMLNNRHTTPIPIYSVKAERKTSTKSREETRFLNNELKVPHSLRETAFGKRTGKPAYSTVTDFARLRGWSTSVPMKTAV